MNHVLESRRTQPPSGTAARRDGVRDVHPTPGKVRRGHDGGIRRAKKSLFYT